MRISEWNRVADEHGFIVVYPSGTGALLKIWPMKPEADLMADVRFISELIDTLEAAYNIDATRIYANGASNGGAMAYALSCKLSHRIAAVGTVSAGQVPASWCAVSRPVPMITFHGTADPIAPYNGGRRSRASAKPFPSVSTWAANWAQRNRCGPNPIESVVAADVTRLEYTDCADDAAVVLYTLRGGGHAWPSGKPKQESFLFARVLAMNQWLLGPTNRNIDATSQMWAFFREHQLPRK